MFFRCNFSFCLLGTDGDYIGGPFEIMFTAGTSFPLDDCVIIETVDDNISEGDHEFSVGVDGISPDGAVTTSDSFTVKITDNDGRDL